MHGAHDAGATSHKLGKMVLRKRAASCETDGQSVCVGAVLANEFVFFAGLIRTSQFTNFGCYSVSTGFFGSWFTDVEHMLHVMKPMPDHFTEN